MESKRIFLVKVHYLQILTLFLVLFLPYTVINAQNPKYLFCFFRGNGENGMFLAYSIDGTTFISLNHDQPLNVQRLAKIV